MNDTGRLDEILKEVSRTFYLSVRILPRDLREPVGLAFLLCKAGDTIADTRLISIERRLAILEEYHSLFAGPEPALFIKPNRARITGSKPGPVLLSSVAAEIRTDEGTAGERALIENLPMLYARLIDLAKRDRALIRDVVASVTEGMAMDLRKFPDENADQPGALPTRIGLDLYCYLVAGSVGEFWTRIHHAHRPALRSVDLNRQLVRAIRFGKGLQMTNILRDIAADLRRGRCYLPEEDLGPIGLTPTALMDPAMLSALRPIIRTFARLTVGHLDAGVEYVAAIPRREWRLRLACLVPLLLALETLTRVITSDNLLIPNRVVKVSRDQVQRLVHSSWFSIWSHRTVQRSYDRRRARLLEILDGG